MITGDVYSKEKIELGNRRRERKEGGGT